MLKDYIRALQTSFTTVTGLRDVLIKIFGKVDDEIAAKEDKIKSATFTGTTNTGGNIKFVDGVTHIVSITANGYIGVPLISSNNTYGHFMLSDGTTASSKDISGTYYYF